MKSKSFDHRLEAADTIIFFDFPLLVIFYRKVKRFLQYFNKVRPDMGGNNKEKITWTDIKFAINYPTKEISSKIMNYSSSKKIFIFRTSKEINSFLLNLKK